MTMASNRRCGRTSSSALSDDAHFLGAISRGALQHGIDGRRGVAQRLRRVLFLYARETSSEANRSPVPDGLMGSFGVRTRQAFERSMARVSISPAGVV